MSKIRRITLCLFVLLGLMACRSGGTPIPVTTFPARATAVLPTSTPEANIVEMTRTMVTATAVPTPMPNPTEPTAVPNTNELLDLVEAELPPTAFESVDVLPLYVPEGERPLWAVYTIGRRNYDLDPVPSHFVALFTVANGRWQELARQTLNNEELGEFGFGPDFLFEQSVTQVDLDPTNIWLVVDGGAGAHAGTFQLLRFDGTALYLEKDTGNASGGVGYLEDLNSDGIPELVLRLHDFYVFCYACGVRYLHFEVYDWDAANGRLQERTIQPMPLAQQGHPAYTFTNRAAALAQAGLWIDALAQIKEGELAAAETAVATDSVTLEWDAALIRLYNQAYQAELNHSPYPLLTQIFYGNYAAALDMMRGFSNSQLFSPTSPVVKGTVAEGNDPWLADYILQQTNAALAVQPELAAAYYFRAWATYLNNPADPQIAVDLQQAAALAPNEPLFSQITLPTANRIQFGAAETAAVITSQLQSQGIDIYTLAALSGQEMTVMLTAPDDQTRIAVQDSQGNYLNGQMSTTFWQGKLPQTGDYVIRVFAGDTAVSYTLQVIIPQRISFAPGAISATLDGSVAPYESHDYILAAQAGQTMNVTITSPDNNVLLTIVGADGIPLTNGLMSGATSWQGELPTTQDYTLRAIGTDAPAVYTIGITIK